MRDVPLPAPTGLRMYVQFHPYSGGLDTRVWRLFPKVSVVTTRATANTAPSSAERTGTALSALAWFQRHPHPDNAGGRQTGP